jgi:fatty acid desaturase
MAPAPSPPARTPDLPTLALLFAMYGLLLGNAALYWSAPLPLPVHVLVATGAIHLAFTIWHESVHRNVSRLRWLNDAIGIVGIFPYMTPYYLQKWIHLQHHSYGDDPRSRGEKLADTLPMLLVLGIYAFAAWRGFLLDVVLLWLLPVGIAKIVMDWYINYLPHVGLPAGRYRGTRVIDVPWLTPLVLGHNYHAIHHLWPALPWHRYRRVFREEEASLREHGVPIERRILGYKPGAKPAAEGPDPG